MAKSKKPTKPGKPVEGTKKATKQNKQSKQRKTAKAKPAASAAAELAAIDPTQADAVLPLLFAHHPPITPAHRDAFASLLTSAQADDLGKRTRGTDVQAEGLRWAVQIDDALRAYPGALGGYGAERFVYFLECLRELHEALGADDKRREKLGLARDAASALRSGAVVARNQLASVLRSFAGRREQERAELAAAIGTLESVDSLGLSLTALAKLGHKWLARGDAGSVILARTAGLTADTLATAVAAATSLRSAAAGASLEGRARSTDTPPVNRAEGRLLFEMIEARCIFKRAAGAVKRPGWSIFDQAKHLGESPRGRA